MGKERMSGFELASLGLIVGVLLGAGGMQWRQQQGEGLENSNKYEALATVDAVLQREYFDKEALLSGQKKMLQEAIKGYVNGLDDPHTSFLDGEEFSHFQEELEGEGHIEGIGAVVSKKDYYVQVEEIIKGSPAFEAGLQPLDRILMIGTGETRDLTTTEAVLKIRGPKGSSVKLFIERNNPDGKQEYLEKEVLRDIIDIPSAKGKILTHNGKKIGYLEIAIFGDQTNKLVNRAITEFIDQKVEGIILDLRGNGGGLLQSAVDIAGHFLPAHKLVVQTKYSNYEDSLLFSEGYGELEHIPLVVLIDGLSASASEILTLALQEHLGVSVIGSKSFGKGSIQTFQEFADKSSLKFTIGKRFGPQGTSIDKVGITPDQEVLFDGTGYLANKIDNQLELAKDALYEKIKK